MAAADKKATSAESNAEAKDSPVSGSENLRGNLVDVAMKFLNNPRVVNSPSDQKKAFLRKKGLTNDEIAEAIRLSELTKPAPSPNSLPLPPRPPSQMSPFTTHTPSHSRTWRDYAVIFAVVGAVGYAIYHFITSYAVPWLNARLEQSARLDEISTTVRQLHTNLDTTISGINESTGTIRSALAEQKEHIQTIAAQVSTLQASSTGSGPATKEIREEMATLKGLLLNRHQFPTPTTTPRSHSVTGIPSWQRTHIEHQTDTVTNGDGGGSEEEGEEKGLGGEDVKTVLSTTKQN